MSSNVSGRHKTKNSHFSKSRESSRSYSNSTLSSLQRQAVCHTCRDGKRQSCWKDVGDKNWYCQKCWDKFEEPRRQERDDNSSCLKKYHHNHQWPTKNEKKSKTADGEDQARGSRVAVEGKGARVRGQGKKTTDDETRRRKQQQHKDPTAMVREGPPSGDSNQTPAEGDDCGRSAAVADGGKSRSKKKKEEKKREKSLEAISSIDEILASKECWDWAREWKKGWASEFQYRLYPHVVGYLLANLLSGGGFFPHLTVSLGLSLYKCLAQVWDSYSSKPTREPPQDLSPPSKKRNNDTRSASSPFTLFSASDIYGSMGNLKKYSQDPDRTVIAQAISKKNRYNRQDFNIRNCAESKLHPGYPSYLYFHRHNNGRDTLPPSGMSKHLAEVPPPLALTGDTECVSSLLGQHQDDVLALLLEAKPQFLLDIFKDSDPTTLARNVYAVATMSLPLLEKLFAVYPPSQFLEGSYSRGSYSIEGCIRSAAEVGAHPSKHQEVAIKVKFLVEYGETHLGSELDLLYKNDDAEKHNKISVPGADDPAVVSGNVGTDSVHHRRHHPMVKRALGRITEASPSLRDRTLNLVGMALRYRNLALLDLLCGEYGMSVNLSSSRSRSRGKDEEEDYADDEEEEYDSSVLFANNTWENPLHMMVSSGETELIETLVKKYNADLHWSDKAHGTPLFWATTNHLLETPKREMVMKLLLELGAGADFGSNDGSFPPPLVGYVKQRYGWTTSDDELRIIELLAEHGADLNATDKDGKSAFLLAVENKSVSIMKHLALFGADVNRKERGTGNTALHLAANDVNMMRVLIKDLDAEKFTLNKFGLTPMHVAACNGNTAALSFYSTEDLEFQLPPAGPEFPLMLTNQVGVTPLMLAARDGCVECVKLLVENKKVKVDTQNFKGFTALYLAALGGRDRVAEILLKNAASVNLASKTGATPCYIAAAKGHVDMVRLLVEEYHADTSIANCQGISLPAKIAEKSAFEGVPKDSKCHHHCIAIINGTEEEFLAKVEEEKFGS